MLIKGNTIGELPIHRFNILKKKENNVSNLRNKSEKMPMNKLLQIDARNQKEQRIELDN